MSNLFSNLKMLCEQRKISIAALEKQLGFSTASIAKWKDTTPGIDKVIKVAEYFDVSIDYLANSSLSEQHSLEENFANSLLQKTLSGKLSWSNINGSNIEYAIKNYPDFSGLEDEQSNDFPPHYDFQQAFYTKTANYYVISLLCTDYTESGFQACENHYWICLLSDPSEHMHINGQSNINKKLYETIYSILYEEPKKQERNQFMTDFISQSI